MHVYFLGVVLFHFIQIGISHATLFDVQKDAIEELLAMDRDFRTEYSTDSTSTDSTTYVAS